MKTTYRNILTETDGPLAIVTLHRPKVLNALNHELMEELVQALTEFDQDDEIRVIVLTGSERAFAAGADIKEMSDETTIGIMLKDQFATWDKIKNIKKPIIAAVSGFALGGGYLEQELGFGPMRADRATSYAFGELAVPLINEDMAVPLVQRLELNLSGRYTDTSDFGDSFSMKIWDF